MKALSIRDPWAGLIVAGRKTIELRTWRTRYRGPILIHRSGKGGGIVGAAEIVDVIEIKFIEQFRALRDRHQAPDEFYLQNRDGHQFSQTKTGWQSPILYGWVLQNIRPVPFVACKGRLGVWEFEEGARATQAKVGNVPPP